MKFVKNIFSRYFLKERIKPLGRWNLDYCNKMNQKVDLSNEDHCGPCGQYIKNKTNVNEENNKVIVERIDPPKNIIPYNDIKYL
jgi:hypothetical protein